VIYFVKEVVMSRQSRSRVVVGLILILVGAWFLTGQLFPGLVIWSGVFSWPMIIIGVGVFLLLFGLLVGAPGMAVPAVIVGGIGGMLYYQNATGDWTSWAYTWTLIPGFVGLGTILAGLFGGRPRRSLHQGINLVLFSLALFLIFAALAGKINLFGPYWPVLIILFGVWILVSSLIRRR
jgi:hypothetical protein